MTTETIDTCDCCGCWVRHEDAAAFVDDRPICKGCGGDPSARTRGKRHGWAYTTFIDARIPVLSAQLNVANQARFATMDWEHKARIIEKMIEQEKMI